MKYCLLDTGPLVAFLDRSEPEHKRVLKVMSGLSAALLTTGAVVTEAFHFVSEIPGGPSRLTEFIDLSALEIRDTFAPETLTSCVRLMEKYADTPMDFSDATLVCLASQIGSGQILTLDRRGFSTFRFGRNRRFHLVLDEN